MSGVTLLCEDADLVEWLAQAFALHAPHLRLLPPGHPDIRTAVCWGPPAGSLGNLPALGLVHSIGSGVDHLASDPSRPPQIPVCRVVDPAHTQGMTEYVHWAVLYFHRHLDRALANQAARCWTRLPQRHASEVAVGVMGLGALGAPIARHLARAGYAVRGWARSARQVAGVDTFAGPAGFQAFLAGLDVLVNLLPLTDATRGILDETTFAALAPGAGLVHCGRGEHLQMAALRQALARRQLGGAVLDTFVQEPLPADDPLWDLPGVLVTPHMASAASVDCIVRQVADNHARLLAGLPLLNSIDPALGY